MSNSKTVVNIEISGDELHVVELSGKPLDLIKITAFIVEKVSKDKGVKVSEITDLIKRNLDGANIIFEKKDGDTH